MSTPRRPPVIVDLTTESPAVARAVETLHLRLAQIAAARQQGADLTNLPPSAASIGALRAPRATA